MTIMANIAICVSIQNLNIKWTELVEILFYSRQKKIEIWCPVFTCNKSPEKQIWVLKCGYDKEDWPTHKSPFLHLIISPFFFITDWLSSLFVDEKWRYKSGKKLSIFAAIVNWALYNNKISNIAKMVGAQKLTLHKKDSKVQ